VAQVLGLSAFDDTGFLSPTPGYLSFGYSTPFLSLGSSYMYPSLAAAKAAVISVGEEVSTQGLPSGICPLVFVFTGTGNGTVHYLFLNFVPQFMLQCWLFLYLTLSLVSAKVSQGAQEIFKLLPHTIVEPSKLPELFEMVSCSFSYSSDFTFSFHLFSVKPNRISSAITNAILKLVPTLTIQERFLITMVLSCFKV